MNEVIDITEVTTAEPAPAADPAAELSRRVKLVDIAQSELPPETLHGLARMANDPTSFLTDRDPKRVDPETGLPYVPYTPEELGRCLLLALAWGFKAIGNEVNIIKGQPVITLAGFARKIQEVPDLDYITESATAPRPVAAGGWLVTVTARCRVKTRLYGVEQQVLVPGPGGPGGRWASRRARLQVYAQLYEQLTGVRVPDGEVQTEEEAQAIEAGATAPGPRSEELFRQPDSALNPHPGAQWQLAEQAGAQTTATSEPGVPASQAGTAIAPVQVVAGQAAPKAETLVLHAEDPRPALAVRKRRLSTGQKKLRDILTEQGFSLQELVGWVSLCSRLKFEGPIAWADWADIPEHRARAWSRNNVRVIGSLLRFRQRAALAGNVASAQAELN